MSERNDQDEAEAVGEGKMPKSAQSWLKSIRTAEERMARYQTRADNIDKVYGELELLAGTSRDRQFQMFWANIEVLKPSIYSRPPVPVVMPRFKDNRPLHRVTSELLERSTVSTFEAVDIDGVMKQVRDDLTIVARGVAWARYETKTQSGGVSERACVEHVDRKDFVHEPARKWADVGWVAKRSWLTKAEMRKRFRDTSGLAYQSATYAARKDDKDADDGRDKAGVWEVWSKTHNKVVWVSEGCDKLLDEGEPHLTLEGFFPCPRPAYATLQRRSLIPLPDMLYYRDQLEEVNQLTARIDSLTDAVKLRGFYPAGSGDIGDAVEAAVKNQADNVILIGVANWTVSGGSVKDAIVWLPLDMVAKVITQLIELRRQVIDDIYQITGLSDIMRGSTVASETLGAQQLKSQYGSIRIRDRQEELIRMARDLTRIVAEIKAENFSQKTLLDMSQMDIPTDADIAKKVGPLEKQADSIDAAVRKQMADPATKEQIAQNPDEAQQVLDQASAEIGKLRAEAAKLKATPTIEKVMKLLRDQRLRPFVLDIETDSTIEPDENAQKQRATEYITAMGGLLAQLPALEQMPEAGPIMAETIRFAQQQFRVGRQMDQVVEEFVDALKARQAAGPAPDKPDPAAAAAQAKLQLDAQAQDVEGKVKLSDAEVRKQESDLKAANEIQAMRARQAEEEHKARARADELDLKAMEAAIRRQALEDQRIAAQEKHAQEMEAGVLNLEILRAKLAQIVAPPPPAPPAAEAA